MMGIASAVYVATRPSFPTRPLVALAVALSGLISIISIGLRWSPIVAPLPGQLGDGAARLTVFPVLLLVFAVALVLDAPDPRVRYHLWQAVVAGVLTLGAIVIAIDFFSGENQRAAGPDWVVSASAAREDCLEQTGLVEATVPITPMGWGVRIGCQRLITRP
jgi:hypothetical protein